MNELFDMVWDRMESRGYVQPAGSKQYEHVKSFWLCRGIVGDLVRYVFANTDRYPFAEPPSMTEDRVNEIVDAVVMPDLDLRPGAEASTIDPLIGGIEWTTEPPEDRPL